MIQIGNTIKVNTKKNYGYLIDIFSIEKNQVHDQKVSGEL